MSLQLRYRKQGEGTIIRPTAGLALSGLAAFGCGSLATSISAGWWQQVVWQVPFFEFLIRTGEIVSFVLFLLICLGIYLYVVNHPKASDFLIDTEAELRKVSWPEGEEYVNASIVVLITIIIIGGILALYDFVFLKFASQIGII